MTLYGYCTCLLSLLMLLFHYCYLLLSQLLQLAVCSLRVAVTCTCKHQLLPCRVSIYKHLYLQQCLILLLQTHSLSCCGYSVPSHQPRSSSSSQEERLSRTTHTTTLIVYSLWKRSQVRPLPLHQWKVFSLSTPGPPY